MTTQPLIDRYLELQERAEEDQYAQLLGEFTASGQHKTQPQHVSERAATLVINSVARFPQDEHRRAATILASRILDSFIPKSRSTTGIGLLEIARMSPDSGRWATKINKIHKTFNVSYRVTPLEALGVVSFYALASLRKIQYQTRLLADPLQFADLSEPLLRPETQHLLLGPWSINRPAAESLQSFLENNPDPRTEIICRLRAEADWAQKDSRAQQAAAKSLEELTASDGSYDAFDS